MSVVVGVKLPHWAKLGVQLDSSSFSSYLSSSIDFGLLQDGGMIACFILENKLIYQQKKKMAAVRAYL